MKKLTLTQGKLMVWDMPKMPDINDYDEDCGYGYDCDRRINGAKAEGVEVVDSGPTICQIGELKEWVLNMETTINEGETIDLPEGMDIEIIYEAIVTFDEDVQWMECRKQYYDKLEIHMRRQRAIIIQKPVEKELNFFEALQEIGRGCAFTRELVDTDDRADITINEAPDSSESQEDIENILYSTGLFTPDFATEVTLEILKVITRRKP